MSDQPEGADKAPDPDEAPFDPMKAPPQPTPDPAPDESVGLSKLEAAARLPLDGSRRLTFEEILEADDMVEEEVPVPEWGGTVLIRNLSEAQYDQIRRRVADADTQAEGDIMLEGLAIVEGMAAPSITEDNLAELRKKSQSAWRKVYAAIDRLSSTGRKSEAAKRSADRKGFPASE